MADLTKQWDIPAKPATPEPNSSIEMSLGVVKIYAGGACCIVKGTGDVVKPDATTYPPKRFVGVAEETVDNSAGSAGDKRIRVRRRGLFKFQSSGLTKADIGKPVFFSDDNTVTTTVEPVFAGFVRQVDADGGVWVEIDAATENNYRLRQVTMWVPVTAADSTFRKIGYAVPVGCEAFIQALKYSYDAKPNYATSTGLNVNRINGTTRQAQAAAVDINNTAVAVDTITDITINATAAQRTMVAGDRLEAQVVTAGAETTESNVTVYAEVLEWGGSND